MELRIDWIDGGGTAGWRRLGESLAGLGGEGGVYAVRDDRTGHTLYCAVCDVAKQVRHARLLLRRGRHSNRALQEDYDRSPQSVSFHVVLLSDYRTVRRFVQQQLVDAARQAGTAYNVYRRASIGRPVVGPPRQTPPVPVADAPLPGGGDAAVSVTGDRRAEPAPFDPETVRIMPSAADRIEAVRRRHRHSPPLVAAQALIRETRAFLAETARALAG